MVFWRMHESWFALLFESFPGFNLVVFDIRWLQLCLELSPDSTLLFFIFAGFNCLCVFLHVRC